MHHAHHPIFVGLSILIACLGSWTALDLFRRVRAHAGRWRGAWILAAAVAMGLSIWAMHFIAMLGFDPGEEVRYDMQLTLLSLVLAIAATAFAFFCASRQGAVRLAISGIVMGAGICIMHYVGMSAVIMHATISNDPVFVGLAFLVAVAASTGALIVAMQERTFTQRAFAAVFLGFAIVGMHYTAMAGMHLSDRPDTTIAAGIDALALAIGIASSTFFILALALIAALSDRRLEAIAMSEALRSEQQLRAAITQKLAAEQQAAAALAEKAEAEAALMHTQRLESLGRLTGGVAHDFNNLLTVVIGALDIILRHPENTERRRRLAESALLAARRGERLTAQLLAFARRQPLQPDACDLNELIRESEPLLKRATGEITLAFHLGNDHAVALIDAGQFGASLLNLVVNAVDASPRHITLETGLDEVAEGESTALAAGCYFRLKVSDDGDGMPPDVLNRIFEPFFTTKGLGKGTGLGLSQVHGFVHQSGGEVTVTSTPGEGTTFTIRLPLLHQPVSTPLPAAPSEPVRAERRPLKVLLAEDDASVAAITDTMLRNLGHEVTRVENAEQALRILRSGRALDLLLSDVVMPGGMNGVELAREAVALRPSLNVLLSSGYAGESLDSALTAGRWPFLRKPYLENELAEQLDQLARADVPATPEGDQVPPA